MIVKISAMGDIVHTFPLVQAIKSSYPDCAIEWVVSDRYVDLVELSPNVDRVLPFRRQAWSKWWRLDVLREVAQFAQKIREQEYDAVIDLQGLLRSGLITFVSRSYKKIGFANAREGASIFYNDKIEVSQEITHAIDRYMSLLARIGVKLADAIDYGIIIPEDEVAWAKDALPDEPYVVINPNARWETKRWPTEKFARLMKDLHERDGLHCVIIGGPADIKRGKELTELAGSSAIDFTNAGGFPRLAAIISRSIGMITNDSGPMHLAAGLNKPVTAIFGSTDPTKVGPYGKGHEVVRSNVDCSPCYKHHCPTNHECMEGISPADVLGAWDKVKPTAGKADG